MYAKQVGLIALMALGSVSLWVANPLLWFWLTSHLQSQAGQPQMGPYVLLVLSVLAAVIAFAAWYLITDPTPPNVGGPGPSKH